MSTISTQLRHFKEPTKDQLTEIFFSIPPAAAGYGKLDPGTPVEKLPNEEPLEKMEINAVLSLGVQGEEDSYVSGYVVYHFFCDRLINALYFWCRRGNCISCHHTFVFLPWIESLCG